LFSYDDDEQRREELQQNGDNKVKSAIEQYYVGWEKSREVRESEERRGYCSYIVGGREKEDE
jgi:hypothetical protein